MSFRKTIKMPEIWAALALVVVLALLAGCSSRTTAQYAESEQLSLGTSSIVQNQPVPNLGGYSLERDLLSQLILLRNEKLTTYTYMFQFGTLVEICPSMGYPFPYATQLTAPEVYYMNGVTIPQSEPNTLYSPTSADASWVMCVRNGQLIPEYFEDRVFAIPYRIKADRVLEPVDGEEGIPTVKMKGSVVPTTPAAPVSATPTLSDSMIIDQTPVEGAPNAP